MPDRGAGRHHPSHPAATTEVGQLLDLGLALGHERFELVNLVGRGDAEMVAAHAWAECGGGDSSSRRRSRDPEYCSSGRSSTIMPQQQQHLRQQQHEVQQHHHRPSGTRTSHQRPPPTSRGNARVPDGRQELQTEVEWFRERVENLSRELVLARKDSGRLTKQLKQEERLGREQRRKADDAIREAKALREELDRLKEDNTASGAASRAVLSDAHSRSVRMAERRRRQQAESLMQAYKGLYEDQLQTQHASAESYRSLTQGHSRVSADNKALRQETEAAVAAVAADTASASDAAGNAAAIIASSSADLQQTTSSDTTSSWRRLATAEVSSSGDEAAWSEKKETRNKTRGNIGGGSAVGAVEPPGSSCAAATAAAAAAAAAAARISDDRSCSSMTAHHAYTATAAESAAAVATAAVAVAAAAGALAEAAATAPSTDHDDPSLLLSTPLMTKEEGEGSTAAAAAAEECARRDVGGKGCAVVGNSKNIRDKADSSSYGPPEADSPSTAETAACSPYSDSAEGPSSCSSSCAATGESRTAVVAIAIAKHGGGGDDEAAVDTTAGDTTFYTDGRAPPADCSLARETVTPRGSGSGALADGDHAGRRSCSATGDGGANRYAFPQTAGEEDCSSPAGDSACLAAAPRKTPDDPTQNNCSSREFGEGGFTVVEGSSSMPGERFPVGEGGGTGLAGPMKAAPPVEPAPRWRGRSCGGPGRLLTSSVSRAEGVDVDAPKRSTSPTPPRRGRWGECVGGGGGGGWGGGGARGSECSRIEPSSRARPRSI